jgi:putative lipoprotein
MRFYSPLIFIAPFVMTLSACATNPLHSLSTPEEVVVESTPTNSVIAEEVTTTPPSSTHSYSTQPYSTQLQDNFRGQLYYQGKKAYFTSCDNQLTYSIVANKTVAATYQKINDNTETPVYVEFVGEINFPSSAKSKNQVVVKVERVNHMILTKNSLQCAKPVDAFRFKANGNNPYWRINMNDNTLVLTTQENSQSFTLQNSIIPTQQNRLLTALNNKGETLTVKIDAGDCFIEGNKEYWGYNTEVKSADVLYSGCGEPGRLINDRPFVGNYQNKLQQFNHQQTIDLTLNADKTAQYVLEDASKRVTKTGFWKSNQQNTLAVMLIDQGGQKIQQELLFERHGSTLMSSGLNNQNQFTEFDMPLALNQMIQTNEPVKEQATVKRQFTAKNIRPSTNIDAEVQAALQQYFKIHKTDPKETRFSSVRFDLNGDGKDEAIVLLDWCSGDACELLIFEPKAKGLVFSSRVSRVAAPILVAETQHFSWQDLLVEQDGKWSQFDFDGLSYPLQLNQAKDAELPLATSGVVLFDQGAPKNWFSIK